jgi:uncharacterized membrane protein YeaQ/YmgE (transglycosylase-associated protein family)
MTPGTVLVWIIAALIFGASGSAVGKSKGRSGQGFWLGALLGIIGVIIIACLRPDREALIRREQENLRIQQEAAARMGGGFPGGTQ